MATYIWNDAAPTTSFDILTGVNVTGLGANGFQDLINSYYVDPTGNLTYETLGGTSTTSTVTGLGTVVPEPTTLGLIALGLCGLTRRRRGTSSMR